MPAGDQGRATATFPAAVFQRLGYVHQHHLRPAHAPRRGDPQPAAARARRTGYDWQANGEARHIGVRLECGIRLENVYVPAGGDIPDREVNPKFGQKLDFIERMTRWSEACALPDHHGRRLQRRAARMRRVEPQAAAQRGQPYADRGRGADQASGRATTGSISAAISIPAPERLHTWWSYRSPDWTMNDRGRRLDHMWATPRRRATGGPATSSTSPAATGPGPRTTFRSSPSSRFERRARRRPGDRRASARLAGRDRRHRASSRSRRRTTPALAAFDAGRPADLLISGNRAATLKLANQRDAVPTGPVRIARAPWLDLAEATAIADPALDLPTPLKGPFRTPRARLRPTPRCAAHRACRAAPGCCRPCSSTATAGSDAVSVAPADVDGVRASAVARHRLARAAADPVRRAGARSSPSAPTRMRAEHVALLIGAPGGQSAARPPPQRMPDRRRARLAQMRLRAAARRRARGDRRIGLGHPALSAPGRARHRPGQQAARLCAAGPGLRHGRRQSAARLRRRRARLHASPRGCWSCSARTRCGCSPTTRARSRRWRRRGSG